MRKLGMGDDSGSPRGDRTRLRNQMRRLFNAHVQLVYADQHRETSVSSSVADRTDFWWNDCKPGETMLFNSKIELGEKFFQEIITHPVPIDMNTLMALKRCFNFQQSVRDPQVRKRNSMDCVRSQQQSQ